MPNLFPITDFADPALDVYARLTENQLVNREDLSQGLFIAERDHYLSFWMAE